MVYLLYRVPYLDGKVIDWFTSYLSDRVQQVHTASAVLFGVPRGLVLGPILFLFYTADLLQLIKRHHLTPRGYADDTQIHGYCQPSDAGSLAQWVSVCIDEVSAWMKANRLQLNSSKTKVLCCASRRQYLIPTESVHDGDVSVSLVTAVYDLGVYFNISIWTHVTNTIQACFSALRQIRSI